MPEKTSFIQLELPLPMFIKRSKGTVVLIYIVVALLQSGQECFALPLQSGCAHLHAGVSNLK